MPITSSSGIQSGAAQDGLTGARSKVDHDARGAIGPFG